MGLLREKQFVVDSYVRDTSATNRPIRILCSYPLYNMYRFIKDRLENYRIAENNTMLKIGFLKIFFDGTLQLNTAKLIYPYINLNGTDNTGIYLFSPEELYIYVKTADYYKIDVSIHTIGDGAVETALNILERIYQENEQWEPSTGRDF